APTSSAAPASSSSAPRRGPRRAASGGGGGGPRRRGAPAPPGPGGLARGGGGGGGRGGRVGGAPRPARGAGGAPRGGRSAGGATRELEDSLPGFHMTTGRSRRCADPVDLYRAGSEARLAVNVGEAEGLATLAFEDTGAYRLLLPAMSDDPAELERFYGETI